ncbi:MAG: succinate dehydrogenase assembly factor 2 [Gammaproteobacteria bacterium]
MDSTRARLRWRCRRGMRELDELLSRFLDTHYDSLEDVEKQAFAALLELPDPELHSYLLGRGDASDPNQSRVLQRLRAG